MSTHDASPPLSEDDLIIAKLENIITRCITAFNNRDFDPKSPGWSSFANSWTGRLGDDIVPMASTAKPKDFLALAERLCAVSPEIKVTIIDMNTVVDPSKRTATMYLTTERSGKAGEADIIKESVSHLDFRYMSGEWKFVRFERMPGGGVAF